ncbi:hypothetical protein CALVIDRAFT_531621 [Calocera viscosa TUFC12733]|uniref:Protein kinase domain-containing protein n=1 Tax=Calocera viscosa (strain TUFC12733) TaxID=1330018 RepID=A0A167G5M0_CALVF|nr:hypothetical protein CALVIDRAFT_531621 [Calocera viscosa TUFC12733]
MTITEAVTNGSSGHARAFSGKHILHRDLSARNVAYRREGQEVTGILLDWDLAAQLDDKGHPLGPKAQHRTGTPAYMSIRLLRNKDEVHTEIDDQESLFYVFLSCIIAKHMEGAKLFKTWRWGECQTIADAKLGFLNMMRRRRQWHDEVEPKFKDLIPLAAVWGRKIFAVYAFRSIEDVYSTTEDIEMHPSDLESIRSDLKACEEKLGDLSFLTLEAAA